MRRADSLTLFHAFATLVPVPRRAVTRAWKARSSTVVQAFRVERIVIKGFLSLDYCFANCSAIREKMKIGD